MSESSLKMSSKVVVMSIVALGLACSGSKNAALEQARNSYQNANQDPMVAKNAPVELHDAEQYLVQAEKAKKTAEVEHYAYLAEQKVKTAKNTAEIKTSKIEQETMKDQRSDILLSARDKEIAAGKVKTKKAENKAANATDRANEATVWANDESIRANDATNRADVAEEETANLQARLKDVQSKATNRGLEFTLQGMLFEFNKAELKPGGERLLEKLALVIKENPERQVLIEGHTDSLGAETYNLELSKHRAESVESFLSQAGIDGNRMSVKGYGKQYPVAPNTSEAGRQQNRRVEVVLLNKGVTSERMKH